MHRCLESCADSVSFGGVTEAGSDHLQNSPTNLSTTAAQPVSAPAVRVSNAHPCSIALAPFVGGAGRPGSWISPSRNCMVTELTGFLDHSCPRMTGTNRAFSNWDATGRPSRGCSAVTATLQAARARNSRRFGPGRRPLKPGGRARPPPGRPHGRDLRTAAPDAIAGQRPALVQLDTCAPIDKCASIRSKPPADGPRPGRCRQPRCNEPRSPDPSRESCNEPSLAERKGRSGDGQTPFIFAESQTLQHLASLESQEPDLRDAS